MPLGRALTSWLKHFLREEDGVITFQNLFLILACCAVGAAGLDTTYYFAARTQLQVAADVGAHAALYTRYNGRTEAQAKAAAVQVAGYGVEDGFGTILDTADIVFGTWNATTSTFTPLPKGSTAMPSAVRVTTNRAGDNPVASLMFRVVGINQMDVRATAVYSAQVDLCDTLQGMFAIGLVAPNSNNSFSSGICVHSQDTASVQSNPTFATGSYISAPDIAKVTCQNKCTGFDAARRSGNYNLEQWLGPLRLTGALASETRTDLLADVKTALPNWNWVGINQTIATSTNLTPTPASVTGRITYIDCRSSGSSVQLSGTYTKTVLLLHDCPVTIQKKANVVLSDTIIYTTSTSPKNSIQFSGSGMQIGNDPNCTGTGVAALLTRGGFNTAAGTLFKNGLVRALGSVSFAAQVGSTDTSGMSVIAGGSIDTTSNSVFNACPPNPNAVPQIVSFRMAG